MIPIKNGSTIFVACPAYVKTGGPELLHQLVSELNQNNIDAKIAYYGIKNNKNYTPNDFKKYIQTFELYDNLQDVENNYIIFPEILTKEVAKFKKAKKIIWWLSVDNYTNRQGILNCLKTCGIRELLHLLHNKRLCLNNNHLTLADYHLCQSYYAIDFLNNRFKNIYYLSDYVNDSFLDEEQHYTKKADYVLYNPKKGINFTKKLIKKAPELNWKPIQNLTTEQVRNLLLESKVYIDFGNHPGKDRFPREAAMCGCCVITNKNGSAKFNEDVPIPEQYKFDHNINNIKPIITQIKQCLTNYNNEIKQFTAYRQSIKNEKNIFSQDVKKIFKLT